jgi:hypothetical protein
LLGCVVANAAGSATMTSIRIVATKPTILVRDAARAPNRSSAEATVA